MSPGVNQPLCRPLQNMYKIYTHLNLRPRPVIRPSGHPLCAAAAQVRSPTNEDKYSMTWIPRFYFQNKSLPSSTHKSSRFQIWAQISKRHARRPEVSYLKVLPAEVKSWKTTCCSQLQPVSPSPPIADHRIRVHAEVGLINGATRKLNSNQNQLIFLCSSSQGVRRKHFYSWPFYDLPYSPVIMTAIAAAPRASS